MVYAAVGNPSSVDQLCSVITSHKEYITVATKGDILAGEAPPKDNVLATDDQKVIVVLRLVTLHVSYY